VHANMPHDRTHARTARTHAHTHACMHAQTHARTSMSSPQDRLPTPFGLVRSGVAPDHQDTKVGAHALKTFCARTRAPNMFQFGEAVLNGICGAPLQCRT